MKIEQVIKQRSFQNEFMKAHINLLYTASSIGLGTTNALRSFDITWQQFNILRILRGMNPKPASVKDLTERMIDKASNASRLVDKLLEKKLVERKVCPLDRRQVEIVITEQGLELLEGASRLVEMEIAKQFKNISSNEARELNRILEELHKE